MFENATNSTKQGDIGESRAIYEYTKLGYVVCRTLFDSAKYDLVIEIDTILYKVQVKTTRSKTRHGVYAVDLRTGGGNKTRTTTETRKESDYDILFVLAENGICWSIPSSIMPVSCINLGDKYKEYIINNSFG